MAQCVEDGDLQCKVPSLLWAEQVGIEGVEGEVEDDVGENEEPKEEVADGYLPKLYAAFRRILLHDGQSDNGSQGPAKKDFLFRLSREETRTFSGRRYECMSDKKGWRCFMPNFIHVGQPP
jgi:hypothetical protein